MADEPTLEKPQSSLELHVRYFDPDRDDAVTPRQTFEGMKRLGLPLIIAAPLALVINVFLGYLTRKCVTLSISVPDIARGKHPFETGVFAEGGRLDEAAFEALFSAPSTRVPRDRLTYRELRAIVLARGDPKRPFGPVGSLLARLFSAAEMFTLFCLASDCQKSIGKKRRAAMSRKNLRRFYEGRLFALLERRRRMRASRSG